MATENHCILPFLPARLKQNDLFLRINDLICMKDGENTDAEIRNYLDGLDEFVRAGLHSNYIQLNWFSQTTWDEAGDYNWEDSYSGGASQFRARSTIPRMSNTDLWGILSTANGEKYNSDGFVAWDNFIQPYVGTNLIQRTLLKTLKLDGKVLDWYEDGLPVNTYSFLFEEFPGWEKAKVLILASSILKNAESFLTTIKDKNCPHALRLSEGKLDEDFVSDIYGEKFYDTYMCFQHYIDKSVDLGDYTTEYLRVKYQHGVVNYWAEYFLSDNFFLDERNSNRTFSTRTKKLPGTFVQLLPAYEKALTNTWSSNTTWEDHFTWEGINVTNLVRISLEHKPMTWEYVNPNTTQKQTWERWATWEGDIDEEIWTHNRPCSGDECIVNRNFIPGFTPGNGISLYNVKIRELKQSIFDPDADLLIARGGIVQYWDPYDILGYKTLSDIYPTLVHTERTSIIV